MLDFFLPTNPTGLFGFLTVLSAIGMVIGLAIIRLDPVGHLVVGCSAIGLMIFGPSFGLFAMSDAKQNEFLEMKAALTPVHQMVFYKSCTHLGAVTEGVTEKNCYDLDVYRVWAVGDRYYIGMVNGDRADIAVIFDRDGMIANHTDSIVFVSPAMDLRRISYAFERVS